MPTLRPYQEIGANRIAASRRLYLGDDPGLGKTPQIVVGFGRAGCERTAVIAPASARAVWRRIWPEWAASSQQLWLYSYDQLVRGGPRLEAEILAWCDSLAIDEVHMAAHTGAQRTRAAMRLANRAPRVIVTSGTPFRNRALDLYPPLRAIWPDVLKRYVGSATKDAFSRTFEEVVQVRDGYRTREIVKGVRNVPLLRSMLDTIMLRRKLTDVGDELPPLRWEITPLDGVTVGAAILAGFSVATLRALHKVLDAGEIPQAPPGDSSIATLRRLHGEWKAPHAARLLVEELDAGLLEKVVVIAYHLNVLDTLEQALQPFGLVRMDGSSSSNERAAVVERFQEDPSTRVFLGQLTTAGQAITLTAAHEIVLVEQSWVPDDNFQAVQRVRRFGQDRPCRARELVIPDSIDDDVARVRACKLQMKGLLSL